MFEYEMHPANTDSCIPNNIYGEEFASPTSSRETVSEFFQFEHEKMLGISLLLNYRALKNLDGIVNSSK